MIRSTVGWLFHWFFQGLKMWFFLLIPLIVFSLIIGSGATVSQWVEQTADIDGDLVKMTIIAIQIFALFLAIALSTYYFADQLDVHPFRKYAPKQKRQKADKS